VLKEKQLGPHALRHFTGQYDEQGIPLFTEGAVLAESVYRFKGQSAQAVVVTEIEFETFSDSDYRKLFVAMTRAKMGVVLVGESSVLDKLKNPLA
jgi:superfamily I DNA and RNA helicase